MNLFSEVIALKPGSKEILEIRKKALEGDGPALKKYVYFAALQQIKRDKHIPQKHRLREFKKLVAADLIAVALERTNGQQ